MSLRTKLLVFSIILALIPLGIAGRSLIKITRDELKSSANDKLIITAKKVTQEIEDFYKYSWLAPLRLIKKAVENEDLGVNAKLSLLTEGIKDIADIVALQISVQGASTPLLVTQDEFSHKLSKISVDSKQFLKLTPEQIETLKKDGVIFAGDLTYLNDADAWLITLILELDQRTFGRRATLSARINLDRLRKRIENNQSAEKIPITLINPQGRKIFASGMPDLSKNRLVKTVKELLASNIRTIGAQPYQRPSGEKMLGAYGIPTILKMGVIVEKNEEDAYQAAAEMQRNLFIWIVFGFSVAVVGAIIVSVSLTRPLLKLTRAARQISQGNLSTRIEGKEQKNEIGELSAAFNKMVDDLRLYIDKLTETTKAKERVESELELGKTIQQGFLPKEFPRFKEIEVWGKCDPAREVGGDYFDFFQIDDNNCGIVIGDVSGKGVPAALFMAVSRTLFRILSSRDLPPDMVLTEFNDRLVALDQGANMFITLFYGVFNMTTGRFIYSTAGHNMPFVKTSMAPGENFAMLPQMKTMVAGMMEGMSMDLAEINLNKGGAIVLYTDGITEAINKQNEEFGEKRFARLLDKYADLPAQDMCEKLIEDVNAFQIEREQFDDMTMFILKKR
ncbi:MAG: SpoIIE family protein phosphatase [Thermodesulfobacteriota bacterium]|nr:SpoIIE family protein phosphatase [Thermodesulfobacteriota bacterium]